MSTSLQVGFKQALVTAILRPSGEGKERKGKGKGEKKISEIEKENDCLEQINSEAPDSSLLPLSDIGFLIAKRNKPEIFFLEFKYTG